MAEFPSASMGYLLFVSINTWFQKVCALQWSLDALWLIECPTELHQLHTEVALQRDSENLPSPSIFIQRTVRSKVEKAPCCGHRPVVSCCCAVTKCSGGRRFCIHAGTSWTDARSSCQLHLDKMQHLHRSDWIHSNSSPDLFVWTCSHRLTLETAAKRQGLQCKSLSKWIMEKCLTVT